MIKIETEEEIQKFIYAISGMSIREYAQKICEDFKKGKEGRYNHYAKENME